MGKIDALLFLVRWRSAMLLKDPISDLYQSLWLLVLPLENKGDSLFFFID